MNSISEKIAEIKALAERASDGPWGIYDKGKIRTECGRSDFHVYKIPVSEDAAFIAASRELIPSLVSALEIAVKALEHPDIEHLDCDCGYFESMSANGGTISHTCVKCFTRAALAQIRTALLGKDEK